MGGSISDPADALCIIDATRVAYSNEHAASMNLWNGKKKRPGFGLNGNRSTSSPGRNMKKPRIITLGDYKKP